MRTRTREAIAALVRAERVLAAARQEVGLLRYPGSVVLVDLRQAARHIRDAKDDLKARKGYGGP